MTVAVKASERIPVDDLRFDQINPRFHGEEEGESQDTILRRLWREFSVDEIALSIAANGFFEHEPVFGIPESGDAGPPYVVIEGNRRLAAVKVLRSSKLRNELRTTDLPEIKDEHLQNLGSIPVILTRRDEVWPLIGFKHVNGPQHWDSMAKAEYVAWVHKQLGVSLADIALQLGDRHTTIARLYGGLTVLEQAENADKFNRRHRYYKRFYFSHLYTALGYRGVMDYLGTNSETLRDGSREPVPNDKLDNLGRMCRWLYGDKDHKEPPLIRRQNPDLRNLNATLETHLGRAALESGQGLNKALDIAKGDTQILRDALIEAKIALQTAKGRVVTGYKNATEIREYAQDVLALARTIEEEIWRIDERASPQGRHPVTR